MCAPEAARPPEAVRRLRAQGAQQVAFWLLIAPGSSGGEGGSCGCLFLLPELLKNQLRYIKDFKDFFEQKSFASGGIQSSRSKGSPRRCTRRKSFIDFYRQEGAGRRNLYEAKRLVIA